MHWHSCQLLPTLCIAQPLLRVWLQQHFDATAGQPNNKQHAAIQTHA
jgi:hypothetical protein